MFKTRLLSGIVLVIILIATVGYGGYVLFGVLAAISPDRHERALQGGGCAHESPGGGGVTSGPSATTAFCLQGRWSG